MNELDFRVIKRDESSSNNPSEGFKIQINSELMNNFFYKNFYAQNKLIWNNSLNDYYFNNDQNLNHQSLKSMVILSSDLNQKNRHHLSKSEIYTPNPIK